MDRRGLSAVAASVRSLTIDAVQSANSGHPGLPMGLAEVGAVLYGEVLKHNPADPNWFNRDRMVLSAGHGCMLLYALLHLCGYEIPLDDIRRFRQLGSKAAGHPEHGLVPGVETTTGPLGQGLANAVGMAIAERMLAQKFNTPDHVIVDHRTYAIAGDGCMMEGVTSEAASLAGHLGLGKLTVFYDSNHITIEGSTALAFSEDVAARYRAYGWHVQQGDAYDIEGIVRMVDNAKDETDRPSLIIVESVIGRGSPAMAGSHDVHGTPLGDAEVAATKKNIGLPENETFSILPEVGTYVDARKTVWARAQSEWHDLFHRWERANPGLAGEWKRWFAASRVELSDLPSFETGSSVATRNASGTILGVLTTLVPNLIGGSADLASSNKSDIKGGGDFLKGSYAGKNMHFGVREHAMGAILNGIAVHGGLRPYGATFLVFADYMRPAIRLAAMMRLPVIYVLTHDSIFVGEDGPTHQPVEHLASLRIIPGLVTMRPADGPETAMAWKMAIERTDGPSVLALSRQGLPTMERSAGWEEDAARGGYVVRDSQTAPALVIVATGSEVGLALEAAEKSGRSDVRVVSMLSRELFLSQPDSYQQRILPAEAKRLVIEAGVRSGWEGIAGSDGGLITIDRFGESGPAGEVAKHLGLTTDRAVLEIKRLLG